MTEQEKTLAEAKIGDKVVVVTYYGFTVDEKIETIAGITKGGNFKIGSSVFYPSGRIRGDYGYASTIAYIATSEDIKRIKEKIIVRKVIEKMRSTKALKYQQAVRIAEILEMNDVIEKITKE